MLTGVPVPATLKPAFTFAESLVKRRFAEMMFRPQKGTVMVGGERYVLVRSDSLYLSWFDALASTLGEKATVDLLYSAAREMGRNDARSFIDKFRLINEIARFAGGLLHMAYAGLAAVEIFDDSRAVDDDTFFLHFMHANTFETEVLRTHGRRSVRCACFFTAGYSAGWCTEALNMHLHTREIQCVARGDERCEFLMAPRQRLDEHHRRMRSAPPPQAAVKAG